MRDRQVRRVGPVHAEHAERQFVRAGEAAETHQRAGHRDAGGLREFQHFRRRIRADDAPADQQHRTGGLGEHLGGAVDLLGVALVGRVVAAQLDLFAPVRLGLVAEHVLGQVDQDGTRAARGRDVEGLLDGLGEVLDILDQIAVLDARPGDADDVGLLEGVVADQLRRHLAGEDHERDRVHVRRGDPGDGVGRAGAGGDQRHSRPSRGAGVAVGRVHAPLLVADEEVLQRAGEEHVVDAEDHAARVPEQMGDVFADQALDEDLGAAFLHGGAVGAHRPPASRTIAAILSLPASLSFWMVRRSSS